MTRWANTRLRPRTLVAPRLGDAPGTGPLVELAGVGVELDRTPVLRGLDLTVEPGEVLGLVGANGSGKSTLLRLLATLLGPTAGSGQVLGAALGTSDCVAVRPGIGLVGHVPALYAQFTLRENLEFLARLTGNPTRAVDEALVTVGLDRAGDRRADRCSQGMRRRADLARVLLTRPVLLLLDEVHTGLDGASTALVDLVVADATARGGATVVVSHERTRLASLAHRVLEIVDGRAVPVAAAVEVVGS